MSFTSMANRKITAYRGKNITIELEMDRAGFRKIAVGPVIRAATTSAVQERALPFAKSISPYDPKSPGPHYRDSFRVTQGFETIAGLRRVATRLHNVSDHSTEVEWKNGSRVLTRTLAHLNQDSILSEILGDLERSQKSKARQGKFDPAQHPRGTRGRFVPRRKTS